MVTRLKKRTFKVRATLSTLPFACGYLGLEMLEIIDRCKCCKFFWRRLEPIAEYSNTRYLKRAKELLLAAISGMDDVEEMSTASGNRQ